MTARRMYELRVAMEEEEKREKEKRKVIKEQVAQFHSQQEGAKQERMEQEKERSLALREGIKKQLLVDRERQVNSTVVLGTGHLVLFLTESMCIIIINYNSTACIVYNY